MAHNTLQQIGWSRRFSISPAIQHLLDRTEMAKAELGRIAALQVLRVRTVGCVTRRAISETGFISQHEMQTAQVIPLAASRCQAVAEVGVLGIAELVHATVEAVMA